jgi:hypothetical protein
MLLFQTLCNTYWAQWTDSDYWNRLMYAIELATQFNENIVLVGDLNSNLLNRLKTIT